MPDAGLYAPLSGKVCFLCECQNYPFLPSCRRTPLPYDPYLDSDYSSLSRNHSTTLVHYISLTTDPLTNTFWSAGFVTNVPEFIVIYNNYFFTKPGSGP